MLTKIRKFGSADEFEAVDHRQDECAFCECARQRGIKFREEERYLETEAIVFLENEAGQVHRIAARRIDGVVVIECEDVTPAARAEIAAREN